jgi:hypothetical protein
MTGSNKFNGLYLELGCRSCESSAVRPFNIISVLAYYIHRIRELRMQQSLMTEESPHSHKATPGKEKTCDYHCNSRNIGRAFEYRDFSKRYDEEESTV